MHYLKVTKGLPGMPGAMDAVWLERLVLDPFNSTGSDDELFSAEEGR